jgi:hypothetical protein
MRDMLNLVSLESCNKQNRATCTQPLHKIAHDTKYLYNCIYERIHSKYN